MLVFCFSSIGHFFLHISRSHGSNKFILFPGILAKMLNCVSLPCQYISYSILTPWRWSEDFIDLGGILAPLNQHHYKWHSLFLPSSTKYILSWAMLSALTTACRLVLEAVYLFHLLPVMGSSL